MHLSSQYAQLPEWTVLTGVTSLLKLEACAVLCSSLLNMLSVCFGVDFCVFGDSLMLTPLTPNRI